MIPKIDSTKVLIAPSNNSTSGTNYIETRRSRLRVQGPGLGVLGAGRRVQGTGLRVQGSGFRAQGPGLRVEG